MPVYWVSEPRINLHFEDEPLGYQPARGLPVALHLTYRQRGAVGEDPYVFSFGKNWTCSFRAFVCLNSEYSEPALHQVGAGLMSYDTVHETPNEDTAAVMTSGSTDIAIHGSTDTAYGTDGFQVEYPDGRVEIYDYAFTNSAGIVEYFLTSSSDPAGNASTFSYTNNGPVLQLMGVTDPEGNTTRLFYDSSDLTLVTRVVDPFSRTSHLSYDQNDCLTNIVDVAGMSSSFSYLYSGSDYWITNLATPYGNTGFSFGGSDPDNDDLTSAGVNRFVVVQLPTGGHELYLYQKECDLIGDWSPTVPNTAPVGNNFSDQNLSYFNSFYWGPLQYDALSTQDPTKLTEADYWK
jgi:hypothetical protein